MSAVEPKPAPRRVRFTLRGLLLVVTAIAVGTAWLSHHYRRSTEEANYVNELSSKIEGACFLVDGSPFPPDYLFKVTYDYQYDHEGNFLDDAKPWGPDWLRGWLGNHLFDRVHSIEINTCDDFDINGTPSYLHPGVSSFIGIEQLRDIKKISIIARLDKVNCDALNGLSQLNSLTIKSPKNGFPLDAISNIHTLKNLDVDGEVIASSRPLMFELRSLAWQNGTEKSLRSLSNENLEGLEVFGNLSKLESVSLRKCDASFTLATKSNLFSLKRLKLGDCEKLQKLDSLENSPLECVEIDSCQGIRDLSALASAPLRRLILRDCQGLETLDCLAENSTLKEIELARICDLNDGKTFFPAVERIAIVGIPVTHLGFLSKSENLQSACLVDSPIEDLAVLSELKELRQLHFRQLNVREIDVPLNQIESFICHGEIERLTILTTKNNRLKRFLLSGRYLRGPATIKSLDCLRLAKSKTVVLGNQSLVNIDGLAGSLAVVEEIVFHDNRALENFDTLESNMPSLTKLWVPRHDLLLPIPTGRRRFLERERVDSWGETDPLIIFRSEYRQLHHGDGEAPKPK